MIAQAFTGSGDLDVDERHLEWLHYGYMKWEMVSYSWTRVWNLGDADASSSGVLMLGVEQDFGLNVCHLGASAVSRCHNPQPVGGI